MMLYLIMKNMMPEGNYKFNMNIKRDNEDITEQLLERLRAIDRKVKEPMGIWSKVKQFHETFGSPVGDKPQFLSEGRMMLRKALIEEEYEEFLGAVEHGDLINAFKELADLIYVVAGTAVEMGGDLDAVLNEVHKSNMSKLDEDGKPIFREDGKVLKGPNYIEPDVQGVLF